MEENPTKEVPTQSTDSNANLSQDAPNVYKAFTKTSNTVYAEATLSAMLNNKNNVENSDKMSSPNTYKEKSNPSSFNRFRIHKMWRQNHLNPDSSNPDFYLEAKLLDNVDEISIIGMRHCIDSNRSTSNRIMWAILIVVGFSLAMYQINDRISYYFQYPTSTEIDVESSQNMTFPQITICNDNYIKLSSAENLGMVKYFRQFMPPYVLGMFNKSLMKFYMETSLNESEIVNMKTFLSPGLEQIALCIWNSIPCSPDFIETIFTDFGLCLAINPRKWNLFVSKPGATMGLQLLLNASEADYFVQQSPSAGYLVLLHEPDEPPRMMELGLKVDVGEGVNVAISVNKMTRMKYPYGSCKDDQDYHPVKCEQKCLTKKIVASCKCRPIHLAAVGNESICDYYTERSCVEFVVLSFYNNISNGSSFCHCPLMCNEVTYQALITGSKFSKNFVSSLQTYLGQNLSYERIMEDYILITAYLSSMQYTKFVTVQGYSAMALLSDVGGALGLLLGSTILTAIEVFETILELFVYIRAKKKMHIKKCKERKTVWKTSGEVKKPAAQNLEKKFGKNEKIFPKIENLE